MSQHRKEDKLERGLDIPRLVAERLITAGFDTLKKVRLADPDDLSAIDGVSKKNAREWTSVGWG